ncbi:MAG TPA: Ig-like domain-containing protein, partial [Caldilineaceae bacterium]|nr:Ig-like domain-containing protein [Caldilineaceae bacterium]
MNWKKYIKLIRIAILMGGMVFLLSTTSHVSMVLAQQTSTPSIFYDFEIIAETGQAGLIGIEDGPSINDRGAVAFVGKLATGVGSQAVFVGGLPAASNSLIQISSGFIAPNHRFNRSVQINNNDKVIAQDFEGDAGGQHTRIRVYDLTTGTESVIASGLVSNPLVDFEAVLGHPSINNQDQVVFSAFSGRGALASECPDRCLVTQNAPNGFNAEPLPLAQRNVLPHPLIADNGRIVVQAGDSITSPIRLYYNNLHPNNFDEIASAIDFDRLGQSPGISDNGQVVAFYGELNAAGAARLSRTTDISTTTGPGIFVWIAASGDIVRITGQKFEATSASSGNGDGICNLGETCQPAAELGYNDAGNPIYFNNYDADSRVAVIHLDLNDNGGADVGDSFLVSFIATPNEASRNNPITQKPFLFSNQKGIWTIRIDVDQEFEPPYTVVYHPTSPLPVVQIDDVFDSYRITDLRVYDPLAQAMTDSNSNTRIQKRGDHMIAFWADTDAGTMILKGTHLDSDQDGLLDHWETIGIDVDQDGQVDLNLPAMGANPNYRDVFLEIDWLPPHDGRDFAPVPEAIDFLVDMFANAPDGGITLHVDAGAGLSRNIGTDLGLLQGGPLSEGPHINFVYFGLPDDQRFNVTGQISRSLDEIKDWWTRTDAHARELVFHYALLVDRTPSLDSNGNFVDDSHVIGRAETAFLNFSPTDFHNVPGNDVIIALGAMRSLTHLPKGFLQGHALAHELGHNLGLQHGGINEETSTPPGTDIFNRSDYKPEYLSLMNYAYQFGLTGLVGRGTANGLMADTSVITPAGLNYFGGARLGGLKVQITEPAVEVQTQTIVANSIFDFTISESWNPPISRGSEFAILVRDYSRRTDLVFSDWDNIRLDFNNYFDFLGNSFKKDRRGLFGQETRELNLSDLEERIGPFDRYIPTVTIDSPMSGASISNGDSLTVTMSITDDFGIDTIKVLFDLNGDGDSEDAGEMIEATSLDSDNYEAVFGDISGPNGSRTIIVSAEDLSGGIGVSMTTVTIESGMIDDTLEPTVSIDTPMLDALIPRDSDLTVSLTANDNVGVDSVTVSFDIDGDDATNTPDETAMAVKTGPANYEAVFANISGPIGPRTIIASAEDTAGNVGVANTTVIVSDSTGGTTAPLVTISTPPSGVLMPLHSDLTVHLSATSQEDITSVTVLFDTDGNGLINRFGEFVRATKLDNDTHEATFTNLSGPVGTRLLRVFVTDAALNIGAAAATVMIGDTTAPSISIDWPTPGMLVPVGNDLTVSFRATDDVDVDSVTLTFDTNGDSAIDASSEIVTPTSTGPNTYETILTDISGPEGRRTVQIFAQDPSLNVGVGNQIVTVGDNAPIVGLGTSVPYEAIYGLGEVTALAYSPDGEKALIGGSQGFAVLLNLNTGTVEHQLLGHGRGSESEPAITVVAISPQDENLGITGGWDGTVRLWDLASGTLLHIFSHVPYHVTSAAFSPDGERIVVGTRPNTMLGASNYLAWLWEVESGRFLCHFEGHVWNVNAVAFSPDTENSMVLSGSSAPPAAPQSGNTARLWNANNCNQVGTPFTHGANSITAVTFAPQPGSHQLLTGAGNNAYLWNWDTRERELLPHGSLVEAVAISSDGKLAATGGAVVKLWDIESGQTDQRLLHTFESDSGTVQAIAFSPVAGSRQMLSGSTDGTVRLWDVADNTEPLTLTGHADTVNVIAARSAPDETQLILTGSADTTARLWNAQTGDEIQKFERQAGVSGAVVAAAISPDGSQVLTGSKNRTIGLWDVETGAEIISTTLASDILAVAFSTDDSKMLVGGKTGDIWLWNKQTSPLSSNPTFSISTGEIRTMTFSQDGAMVIVGFSDGSAQIGNIVNGVLTLESPFAAYTGHNNYVSHATFSDDGSWVLTGGAIPTVVDKGRLWNTTTGNWRVLKIPTPDVYYGYILA